MIKTGFPRHWSTLEKLIWLRGSPAGGAASYETVTGNPVSFTAKAAPLRQLEVAFSPVQDLHGYDSPWPAGGGKNLLEVTADDGNLHGNLTITRNADGTYQVIGTSSGNAFVFGTANLKAGTYTFSHGGNVSGMYLNISGVGNSSVAGSNFTISEDAVVRVRMFPPANGTVVNGYIEPMICLSTSATAYAPYSNECPISGWDSLTVEQRGKNLFPSTDRWYNSRRYSGTGGAVIAQILNDTDVTIPASVSQVQYGWCKVIPCKAGQTYTFKFHGNKSYRMCIAEYATLADAHDYTKAVASANSNNDNTVTFTAEQDDLILCAILSHATDDLATLDGNEEIQVELGATASNYQPFNPSSRSISISLGQTVYSGTVDVVTGVVTVDMASVDMGTLGWSKFGTPLKFYASISDRKPTAINTNPNLICSNYKTGTTVNINVADPPDKTVMGRTNSNNVIIADSDYSTETDFATAMSGVQLVYELAEPLTIQLTPQEVESLAGDNTMWSDANGDLTVEYRSN